MNYITTVLGKWLFPHLPHDLRERRINVIYLVLFVGLLVSGAVALSMLKMHGMGAH